MIKVIEQKEEPRAQVTCDNCHSILEYGNCDIRSHIYTPNWAIKSQEFVDYYYLYCSVCNCEIKVSKIIT